MLRLTKKADYGLMALKYLAEQCVGGQAAGDASVEHSPAAAVSAKDIAEAYHIPSQLLAKILQTLVKASLLVSHAGTNGGYSLARDPRSISAFEVIRAIDGPLFITSCITIHGTCDLTSSCTIKEPLRKVNDSITELLSRIRIADLCESTPAGQQPPGQDLVTLAH
ncbi:MAG: RrF2 family transcriptional regulator [Acidobacteriaceae bacterium]